MPAEPIQVLLRVVEILDRLAMPYVTGGSVASSILGVPRATQDVDIVIDLPPEKAKPFVAAMQAAFYIDADAVDQAIHRRSSFNAIHLETVLKVDFFICRHGGHADEEMRRRVAVDIDETTHRRVFVASPEDIILQKLAWYRMGSRISERQWNDVLGVMKVQGGRLDRDYLSRWAKDLGVDDLLVEALAAAAGA
jgi:hypothetical protein